MDFLEFDSFTPHDTNVNLPQPQPALSIPIATNLESFSKKFSNFSLSRNLSSFSQQTTTNNESGIENSGNGDKDLKDMKVQESKVFEKYVKQSLLFLEKDDKSTLERLDILVNRRDHFESLGPRLARVLNDSMSESTMKELFSDIENKKTALANSGSNSKLYEENQVKNLVEPGFVGAMTRKKLRSQVEFSLTKTQTKMLKEYQPILRHLKVIESRLKKLNDLNDEINTRLNKTANGSTQFTEKVGLMSSERTAVEIKQGLLTAFKSQFTLNEYEEFILASGDLNHDFFEALAKAEQIVERCSILLSEDNPQLGLKIMSKMNNVINKAIDRIVTYCNKTLDNTYSLSSKARLQTLHECFKFLKNKLNFLSSIVDKFSASRSKAVLEEFYKQTQASQEGMSIGVGVGAGAGVNSGVGANAGELVRPLSSRRRSSAKSAASITGSETVRPVYMSAHDPIRYVGDFLAYVHSLAVNESETIKNIFTMGDDNDREFDNIIYQIRNKVLQSLARPIKSRIEQLIFSETKLSIIFQIFNLVELYSVMFAKQLHDSEDLVETMLVLVKSCQDKIFSTISGKLASIRASNQAKLELNSDLQPPEWIIDFYSEILYVIDQVTTKTVLNLPPEENERFLKLIVNEPIRIFKDHVQHSQLLLHDKRDTLIIQFNFLDLVQSKIMPISILSDKVLEINDMNLELTKQLTELELTQILKGSQLYDYYNIINMICPFTDDFFEVSIYEPIIENKLYNLEQLHKADSALQEFLPNAMIEIQQSLLKLNSPVTVSDVIDNAFIEFIKFYQKLNTINKEYLQYSFTWSTYDIATLLGIEESRYQDQEQN